MRRVDGERPTNDNLPSANDNRKNYMRDYMARRRHGAKTLRQLLQDGLALVVVHAPADSEAAQIFVAAVRDLLQERAQ